MNFYDDPKNVNQYIEMAEGYNGRDLLPHLHAMLPAGSHVLELGMGPGADLDLLAERYRVTGSDLSAEFLKRYRATHPDADLLQLDALTIQTDRTFDAIYSNKVLHMLTSAELTQSLQRQQELLNPGGVLFHTFWQGDGVEEMQGMAFTYYSAEALTACIPPSLKIHALIPYAEMDDNDSFLLILQAA